MRLYDIEVGGKSYSSRNNPNALNVELDITAIDADSFIAGSVVIWGIALEDISQANDLVNKEITVTGGMQQGLPFATQQAAEAGVLLKGWVLQSFGNWVGTEMWLTLICHSGPPPDKPAAPNAPNPPPRDLVLNWKKGTNLSDALQQTLKTGFPGVNVVMNISSQLVAPQDNIGFYQSLRELNTYVRGVSHQLMTGNNKYPGVGMCLQKGELTVHDGTSSSGAKEIDFIDLVGQPTWIGPNTIQVRVVMRGDLKVGIDDITLPPTRVVVTTEAQSGLSPSPLTFQGTFHVIQIRHVGNFRQSDGAAWVTIIDALKK